MLITGKHDGFKSSILQFDHMSDFADHVAANCTDSQAYVSDNLAFYTAQSCDALAMCRDGDLAGVAASDALLERFEALTMPSARKAWADGVAGALPNVQAFLVGTPLTMRRKVRTNDDCAPLTIYAELFASQSFTPAQIIARGAAILALVRIMSARRPVTLYAGCSTENREKSHHICAMTRIDTAPIDLARAAYAITNPAFLRRVTFSALHQFDVSQSLPAPTAYHSRAFANVFASGETLILPPLVSDNNESIRDPQGWIARQIQSLSPEALQAA